MRRQKRFKNVKVKWPTGRLLIASAVLAALIMSYMAANAFIHRSAYFKLKAVEARDAFMDKNSSMSITNDILQSYKGQNIFKIDLKQVLRYVQAAHPDAKRLSLKRVLPDKLAINFNFRKPVALVTNSRNYPIDEECFVLPNVDARYLKELPLISGINIGSAGRRGGRIDSRNLRIAVELLKEMRRSRLLSECGIATIDAGDIKTLSFYLKNGIEVKIGCENFADRLTMLTKTLRDSRLLIDRIQYIDVRFGNAVVGPKE